MTATVKLSFFSMVHRGRNNIIRALVRRFPGARTTATRTGAILEWDENPEEPGRADTCARCDRTGCLSLDADFHCAMCWRNERAGRARAVAVMRECLDKHTGSQYDVCACGMEKALQILAEEP